MKYISNTIAFAKANPLLLSLFVFFNIASLPIDAVKHMRLLYFSLSVILWTVILVISLYLLSGIHALVWKRYIGTLVRISGLHSESKIYFPRFIFVNIVVGMMVFFVMIIAIFLHKIFLYPELAGLDYWKRVDANVVQLIPGFVISLFFIYALPAIFVANLSGEKALSVSWRFLIKNISNSLPLIYLLFTSFILHIVFIQLAVAHSYNSKEYWLITALSSLITHIIGFMVFLTAAQIFAEYHDAI